MDKRNQQSGFTLIELLVVVATLSILATIAIPTYLSYVARTQVATGIASINAMQDAAADYYQQTGDAPPDRLAIGYSASGSDGASQYVTSVDITDGTIAVLYNAEANSSVAGTVLRFGMAVNGDNVVQFVCNPPGSANDAPTGMTWADGSTTSPASTVPAEFLPADCRA